MIKEAVTHTKETPQLGTFRILEIGHQNQQYGKLSIVTQETDFP